MKRAVYKKEQTIQLTGDERADFEGPFFERDHEDTGNPEAEKYAPVAHGIFKMESCRNMNIKYTMQINNKSFTGTESSTPVPKPCADVN